MTQGVTVASFDAGTGGVSVQGGIRGQLTKRKKSYAKAGKPRIAAFQSVRLRYTPTRRQGDGKNPVRIGLLEEFLDTLPREL